MGASEGKEVGQWFGPNTVAQVLKYVFFSFFFKTIIDKRLSLLTLFIYFLENWWCMTSGAH